MPNWVGMVIPGYRRSKYVFIAIGACLVALAVALNVTWVVVNWRTSLLMVLGALFFAVIIAGVVLNTIFLVREIRRNERHDAFINAVTHELKTPIASIRLYLETLQKRPLEERQRQEFYGVMLEDSDRLLQTVEQVLCAGRTARAKLERERINLPDLVAECVDLVRIRHHLTRDALDFETRCDRAEILGEADELRTAVNNLLDNAIKYSGNDIRVDVYCERPDAKRVLVRVKDQGIGISQHELKRVFGRFYRIPGGIARRVKGTGLGLFIVRSVAKRHGGHAFAESDGVGFGSTFTLQFPVAPPSA